MAHQMEVKFSTMAAITEAVNAHRAVMATMFAQMHDQPAADAAAAEAGTFADMMRHAATFGDGEVTIKIIRDA